jgi:hypothetical protein
LGRQRFRIAIAAGMGPAKPGAKTMSKRRIVWVDDSKAEFDRVDAQWSIDGLPNSVLDYCSLDQVTHENGEKLNELLSAPPDVLVLDWNEGNIADAYDALKKYVKLTILVSWNGQDTLRIARVFEERPELEDRTLTKPFSAAQLKALIERVSVRGPAGRAGIGRLLSSRSPSSGTSEYGLEEHLAIRYLNAMRVPVSTSRGWKLGIDRPELTWTAEQINDLESGKHVHHSLFSPHPSDPECFGPVLFVTWPLAPDGPESCRPPKACYLQQGLALPEDAAGIEAFGRSVDGIIELMRQAGFARGRYYHLTDVPGLKMPSLELVARYPDDPERLPLPASKALSDIEQAALKVFCERRNQQSATARKNELIYTLKQLIPNDDVSDEFWDKFVNDYHIHNRLEVPVFLTRRERDKLPADASALLRDMRGLFIFDRGNQEPLKEGQVKAVERSLLAAIAYFRVARLKERERFEEDRAAKLLQFHDLLGGLNDSAAVEAQLIATATHVVGLDSHGGVTARNQGKRSAMYADFNMVHQRLEVSCETDMVMCGFAVPLQLTRFVMVRCALRALDGDPLPVCEPDFDAQSEENRIRKEDWLAIPQCTPEHLPRCMAWLTQEVKAVAAFPVMSSGKLLGVLVLRSNRTHEFTRRRVEAVRRVIDVALPYLERLRNEANRKLWDGLVMHEMRSNLSWAASKVDRLEHATLGEQRQLFQELMFVLDDGIGLSSLFLEWLGFKDTENDTPTEEDFWMQLDEYGQFRSRSSERLNWRWEHGPHREAGHALQLGRAVRVLIDNAFRYAMPVGDQISCQIMAAHSADLLTVKISNPGNLRASNLSHRLENVDPSPENLPRAFKAEIGLTLVRMLCHEVGVAGPDVRDEVIQGTPCVVATLVWPLVSV